MPPPNGDANAHRRMEDRFRDEFLHASGRSPDSIYATLRADVFTASLMAVRYFVEHRAELYGAPDEVLALVGPDALTAPFRTEQGAARVVMPGEGVSVKQRRGKGGAE